MADEITFGYTKGTTLSYAAYHPDGTERTAKTSLPEWPVDSGYFHEDDDDIKEGDFVIITDDDLSDRVVGYGQYGPLKDFIKSC